MTWRNRQVSGGSLDLSPPKEGDNLRVVQIGGLSEVKSRQKNLLAGSANGVGPSVPLLIIRWHSTQVNAEYLQFPFL